MREIRVSPDGDMVAIRTDYPADSEMAWGVFHVKNGAHWETDQRVTGWPSLPEVGLPKPASEAVAEQQDTEPAQPDQPQVSEDTPVLTPETQPQQPVSTRKK